VGVRVTSVAFFMNSLIFFRCLRRSITAFRRFRQAVEHATRRSAWDAWTVKVLLQIRHVFTTGFPCVFPFLLW
jgi:hypothetical protein